MERLVLLGLLACEKYLPTKVLSTSIAINVWVNISEPLNVVNPKRNQVMQNWKWIYGICKYNSKPSVQILATVASFDLVSSWQTQQLFFEEIASIVWMLSHIQNMFSELKVDITKWFHIRNDVVNNYIQYYQWSVI